ncbi:MAG TPA: pseudaminic acid synthase [Xanthobacteraceae bacterium]|nr:pseudaminic acid synthase [Xanthobacteraceae bacterium]
MPAEIAIAGRRVGAGSPPYIVAELSANHGGSLDHALASVDAAKEAGADAIKLQTYTADTITIDHDGPDFRVKGGPWNGRRLYELYKEAHTPWPWHEGLFARAGTVGITAFSTPFDATAVDLLERLRTPAYKIASFEMIDLPLIRRVAQTGKPTIMSTGMASRQEIGEAIEAFHAGGGRELVLLHCVSGYPVPVEQSNLLRIPRLAAEFGCAVGLSDHSLGVEVAIAAVALGACMIEKHFTLRRADGGPDAAFSLEPNEFAALVSGAAAAFAALGSGDETRAEIERGNMPFRRSIYVVRDVRPGEIFTAENLRIIRPGYGLAPKYLPEVIGKHAARALARGTALSWDAVS